MRFWILAFAGMTVMQRSPTARTREVGEDGFPRPRGHGRWAKMDPRVREDNGRWTKMGPRHREDNGEVDEDGFSASARTTDRGAGKTRGRGGRWS